MAGHARIGPFVRGDPATFAMLARLNGVDQDITGWTWRSFIRDRINGTFITECETFNVVTPDDLPDFFEDGGTTPSVLLLHWTMEQTALWKDGIVCDIEQLTPIKRTWVIFDGIDIDPDVSYDATTP